MPLAQVGSHGYPVERGEGRVEPQGFLDVQADSLLTLVAPQCSTSTRHARSRAPKLGTWPWGM